MEEALIYLSLFVVGLILGSFYNVLIYRLPRNVSILYPPSHCPHCKQRIRWYDNIPLLSFFLLRGRCRYCGEKISIRYPLVELSSGLLAVLSYYRWGLTLEGVFYYFFFSALLVISLIDWFHFIIPPQISIGGTIISLALSPFRKDITPLESFVGVGVGVIIPLLIYLYYVKIRKIEGIGLGDVILLGFIGSATGIYGVFSALFIGSFIGLLYVIPLVIKHRSFNFAVPFGPFLSLGAFIGVLFKEEILSFLGYANIVI
ncbi:A24 family peptidase [Aquifex pyrophilus]